MWELVYKESWVLKNWCFELWCWRRLLRVPWTARRSNQSILKEISPGRTDVEAETPNFGHLMQRADFFEKRPWCWGRLRAGGEGDDRGWDGWMASPTQWTWVWVNSGSCWWTGRPGVLQSVGLQRVRHNWAAELNWLPKVIQMINLENLTAWRWDLHLIFPIPNQGFYPQLPLAFFLMTKSHASLQGTHTLVVEDIKPKCVN